MGVAAAGTDGVQAPPSKAKTTTKRAPIFPLTAGNALTAARGLPAPFRRWLASRAVGDSLQGTFGKIGVETLVRFLADNGLEGVLDVRGPGGYGALEVARGQLTGATWGSSTGEPALAALVAAAPTEFRFRSGPTKAATLNGDIAALFGRAHAFASALRPSGATGAEPVAPGAADVPTSMVTIASMDPRVAEASRRGILAPMPKPPAPQRARSIGSVWKPGDLVALANAVIAEYADEGYGGLVWDRDLTSRVKRVDAYRQLAPPLPMVAGRIDGVALTQLGHDMNDVVPYLRAVVREIYSEADRAVGGSAARRGYRNAITKLWGPSEELWAEATRVVETERDLRGRMTLTRGLEPRSFELVERDYSFGRGGTNDVVLKHQTVSRRHATITPRHGKFVLKDLASTSGTLVNGKPIKGEVELAHGDVVELGQVALRFESLS